MTHERDPLKQPCAFKLVYNPDDHTVNDHCLIKDDHGVWHLFYIYFPRDERRSSAGLLEYGIGHAASADLIHWKEIGIQATVKPEDVALWVTRATAGEHHVSVYGASGGFRPLMDPVWFFPSASYAYWAPLHGLWYSSNGRAGVKPTGEIMRLVEIYDEAMTTLDEERQQELVKEAVRLHAENLWRIGVCGGFDALFVVKNYFRNVPDVSFSDNPLLTPGHTHPEQYFMRQNGRK